MRDATPALSRRRLFEIIGASIGGAAAYQAMTRLGYASESPYRGPIKLDGDPKGASVIILGAGLAGMTAAIELERAGYRVSVLEYNDRPGGRNWSLRGGDVYTELGGATQKCEFDAGLYLNPGPWRIPYHHYAILDYCRRFGVTLEPFIQLNHNAYLHSANAFDGKPQRIRDIKADFDGGVAELLAKATKKGALDDSVSTEDQAILLEALRSLGALDKDFRYRIGEDSASHRGFAKHSGGGLGAEPIAGEPIGLHDILTSRLWRGLQSFLLYDFQTTMFQPVGGMGRIGEAFARQIPDRIRYGAKVIAIHQSESGVTVAFEDVVAGGVREVQEVQADWCVCALPLSILSQIPVSVSAPMKAAIDAVPYASAVKFGLQFKRRFWEEDEHIFGGISYTDLPIRQISYPSTNFNAGGKGVLLGGYTFDGANSYEFAATPPAERVKRAVEFGAQIHPQYLKEFENGVSVAWSRVPFTLGCAGDWSDEARKAHYNDLCQIDGRIVLAGEHASYIPAWQEGAILSAGRDPAAARAGRCVMRLFALRAVALVVWAACGAPALADDAPANSAGMSHGWEFSEQGGADLFRNVCAGCHQPDAKGAVGAGAYPSLVADKKLASGDYVLDVLVGGLRGMPPVGGMMTDAQVADVVNYVRTHFGNAYASAVSAADIAAARRLARSVR